jgi:excisionase family DNA binding protein
MVFERPDLTRRLLTVDEACTLAKVCRRTMFFWMSDGKVEWVRTAGGRRRIFEDSLFHVEPRMEPAQNMR